MPYFSSEEKLVARSLVAGVIGLTLLQTAIQIRLNIWNRDFFNALEARDWRAFVGTMGLFAVLAGAGMGTAVYQVYLKQLLQLRWRRWLTSKLVAAWLENGRHYQLNFIDGAVDNPDQRIAENVRGATELAMEFALGILTAGAHAGFLHQHFVGAVRHFAGFARLVRVRAFRATWCGRR